MECLTGPCSLLEARVLHSLEVSSKAQQSQVAPTVLEP